jgi:hypothetical protein
LINRRNGIACRQRHKLLAPAIEVRIGADEESAGMSLDEEVKGGLKIALGAGFHDIELNPLHARRILHVSLMVRSTVQLFGFTSRATTPA